MISAPSNAADKTLTDQQHRAVHTRNASIVLSSGAGCGKTHVLTARYLSHLRDDEAEVGQVVAITFTDRAARQMRGRIREAVETLLRAADGPDADTWGRHLRNLETAPISTIHAFCAALLRQYAVEAGVDPRFDVLEEVLSVNLESDALNSCLQRLLTAPTEPGEDLRQLVLLYGWRMVVEGVTALLRSRDETRWREWLDEPAGHVARRWCDHARRSLLPRRVAHLLGARPHVTRCLDLLRQSPPLPGLIAENVRRLLEELPRLAQAPDPAAAVLEFHELAKVMHLGKKAWPDPAVYEPIKNALAKFRDELKGWDLACFDAAPEELAPAVEVGRRWLRVRARGRRCLSGAEKGAWRPRFPGPVDGRRATCCATSRRCAPGFRSATTSSSSTNCRTPTRCRWNWRRRSAERAWRRASSSPWATPTNRSTASAGPTFTASSNFASECRTTAGRS